MNVCICEHSSGGDEYGVDPLLNHHYSLKGKQTYTIIHVCVFVNAIQKKLEMDLEYIPSQPPIYP